MTTGATMDSIARRHRFSGSPRSANPAVYWLVYLAAAGLVVWAVLR